MSLRSYRFSIKEDAIIEARRGSLSRSAYLKDLVLQDGRGVLKDTTNVTQGGDIRSDGISRLRVRTIEDVRGDFGVGNIEGDLVEVGATQTLRAICKSCAGKMRLFNKVGDDWQCSICDEFGSEMNSWI